MTQYNAPSPTTLLEESRYDATGRQVTRAAIFCTDEYEELGCIARERPIWLLPIAGRPMLDRVLGNLTDFGIKYVDLFVSHHAIDTYRYVAAVDARKDYNQKPNHQASTPIRELGSRWGLEIKIIDVTNTYEGLRRLVYRELDEPILIGNPTSIPPLAECFPEATTSPTERTDETSETTQRHKRDIRVSQPILFQDTREKLKSSWMIARPEGFVSEHCRSLEDLASTMLSSDEVKVVDQQRLLSVYSVRSVLHSQRLLLEEAVPGQPIEASHVEQGLWISRNVDLHPSVRLIPPVYIGADCRIESGVVLGPNAVIENHCIIEERTNIADSHVLPDTFVGHELSLNSAIAGPCFMQTLDAPQPIEGIDPFIIGPNQRVIPRFLTSRLLAKIAGTLALCLLFIPILLLWGLGRICGIKRPLRVKDAVQLPAYGPPSLWRTFRYREFRLVSRGGIGARFFTGILRLFRAQRWPALPSVVSGKVAWVGLRPRSVAALASLPDDYRTLTMKSKVGLIRLAELDAARHGHALGDQEHASDIYYVAKASPWFDVRLLWRAVLTPDFQQHRKQI